MQFRVAAFTNLTRDHLDFHGSMEAYAAAKTRLFTECAPGGAVVCVDDPFGRTLAASVRAPVIRVSAAVGADDADIAPRRVDADARGIHAQMRTPGGEVAVSSPMLGQYNVENIAVALGVAQALSIDVERAAVGISAEPGAPGRLERCEDAADDVVVLVDYAHTPDALARVLSTVRAVSRGRLWCVFGCGGDRDAGKRPAMGAAAARFADAVIVTDDNPRTESPAAIAANIEAGLRAHGAVRTDVGALAGGARGYALELDRRRAVEAAVLSAAPGDVVVLAGKGHEDYQIVGNEKRHLDDREEARRVLALRRARGAPIDDGAP